MKGTSQDAAVLFADIRGFTAYTATAGDATALSLARQFAALVAAESASQGGRLVKTYGDGAMVEFGESAGAVRAAVGIVQALGERNEQTAGRPLAAGVGICSGPVLPHEDDVFGHTVNTAKRLADQARGGQIVLCAETWDRARGIGGIGYLDLGEISLKGLPPQRAYEAVWREELARMTARDDGLVLILTQQNLVVEFSKTTQARLLRATEELLKGAEKRGIRGFILRRLGSRIPRWIEKATASAGLGFQHDLDKVDLRIEGTRVVLRTSGWRVFTLDRSDFAVEQARAFVDRFDEVKRSTARAHRSQQP